MRKLAPILLISLLLYNCEELFHPENQSIANIERYDELLLATGGVYGKLSYAFNPYRGWSFAEGFYWPNLKGDDIMYGSGSYNLFNSGDTCIPEFIPEPPYEYQERSSILWQNIYSTLASVNNILNQYPDFHQLDEPTRHLLGELYLIRAYCHFRLSRCFGRIPVITDRDVSYSVKLSEYDDIYRSIERDLKRAGGLLPIRASQARIPFVTPHRGSTKVLLAEVYLNWAGYPAKNSGKYHEAARESGEVIDSAVFFDLGLLSDFADIWKNDPFNNIEAAFSIDYADPALSSSSKEVNTLYKGILGPSYWPGFLVHPDSLSIGIEFYGCEINFYNNYPPSYRKDQTFYTRIYVPADATLDNQIDTGYIYIDVWPDCERPCYRKFYLDAQAYPSELFGEWWMDALYSFGLRRIYFFRFAHTLLTYAEAKARAGELDASAYDAINRIRRRANNVDQYLASQYDLTPGLSAEAFADSVVWERAWELAGESEGRWFDLVRLEKVESLTQLRSIYEGGVPDYPITKEDYFFPIPEEDIRLNPNLQD